ncbi:hypothetical protein E0H82_01795 [Acinetobacter sp. ANC 4910]|nr:hypothetical protein E0H82_01795 [Acinetobacter sp. ANC 4910]
MITEYFSRGNSQLNIWGCYNNEGKLLYRYNFLDMNMQSSCAENDKIFSPSLFNLKNKNKKSCIYLSFILSNRQLA